MGNGTTTTNLLAHCEEICERRGFPPEHLADLVGQHGLLNLAYAIEFTGKLAHPRINTDLEIEIAARLGWRSEQAIRLVFELGDPIKPERMMQLRKLLVPTWRKADRRFTALHPDAQGHFEMLLKHAMPDGFVNLLPFGRDAVISHLLETGLIENEKEISLPSDRTDLISQLETAGLLTAEDGNIVVHSDYQATTLLAWHAWLS